MGEQTSIAWTNRTWNPWQGCTKVSAGCHHCYMYRDKARYGQVASTVVRSARPTFNAPLKWERELAQAGKVERCFVCSWSDFFHHDADAWRAEAWDIIHRCRHLTFQLCTKRPERILACLPTGWGAGWPNVWVGTTVEDRSTRVRLDVLREVPAAVRFVSAEPLLEDLGEIDLAGIAWVIAGGESGPGARPCDVEWIRGLHTEARVQGAKYFVKQLGANPTWHGKPVRAEFNHATCADPAEWSADLRVRELPIVTP